MLVVLNIKNFALIQELSVEFGAGFNILSGEIIMMPEAKTQKILPLHLIIISKTKSLPSQHIKPMLRDERP